MVILIWYVELLRPYNSVLLPLKIFCFDVHGLVPINITEPMKYKRNNRREVGDVLLNYTVFNLIFIYFSECILYLHTATKGIVNMHLAFCQRLVEKTVTTFKVILA